MNEQHQNILLFFIGFLVILSMYAIYYLKKGIRIILFYLYSIIKKNNTSTSKTSNQE
jgi:hypothetical protein